MEINQNNNSTKAVRETFWSLLKDHSYTVCIPRIQRDYVQGRSDKEAEQIRHAFVRDIFSALENDTPMDINFIYGNKHIDKEGINRFIPIDGQQRLTTLFLLHWYLAMWSGELEGKNKDILGKFQYETRFVTADFCNRLVNEVRVDLKELAKSDGKLDAVIKDYYWFFSVYERDATIKSMITMLEEIHNTVKNLNNQVKVDGYFEKLTNGNGLISFLFLDIADVGLTDEIYIKMNARGKALTRFENFKAQLSGYLAKTDGKLSKQFLANINGVWSQFFWHEEYRPSIKSNDGKMQGKSNIFDDQIMKLFIFIMTNEFICNAKTDGGETAAKYLVREVLREISDESDFQFVNHYFADEFRSVYNDKGYHSYVDAKAFSFIYTLLNILSTRKTDTGDISFASEKLYDKKYIDEESYFKRLIRSVDEKELSYEEKILLYAEFCFLVKYADADYTFNKTTELTEWLRFIYNLSSNMLYNGYDDYYRSIRRVRNLVDSGMAENILEYAGKLLRREYKQGSGYGFVENQMTEECMKANLILRGDEWRTRVKSAENSFLGSQIAALLSFSGIWKLYEGEIAKYEETHPMDSMMNYVDCIMKSNNFDQSYMDSFDLYLAKFNLIFNRDAIKPEFESESLLRRALLTYGGGDSYMLPHDKPTCCFLDATDRDTSFRRLFRGDNFDQREYFKQLLDSIDPSKDVVKQLESIIENMVYDDESRWKRYFIEMPEILECMYQNTNKKDPSDNFVFKNTKRFINKRSADLILLLEKTKTTSINREYYSYVLYLKAKKKGFHVHYFTTFNENTEKYLFYTNNQNHEIQVIYAQDANNGYKYFARDNTGILYKANMDNMMDYIEQSIK